MKPDRVGTLLSHSIEGKRAKTGVFETIRRKLTEVIEDARRRGHR